tara:strand:+ start:78 stop:602 length:525 start_codon:yes stop_codon:yes gene_type:complete
MNKKKDTIIKLKIFKAPLISKTNYFMWLKDKEVIKYLYRQELFLGIKKKQIYKYVNDLDQSKNDFFYLIIVDKKIIGTVKLGHVDWYAKTGDIGIMIGDKNYWGKGYATRIIKIISKISKKKFKLRKLIAGTPGNNIGMIKAFKKNNFKVEGIRKKHLLISRKYVDHILFGKII